MTDIWFAADLHLSHKSLVLGFDDGRPGPRGHFGTVEAHDQAIIDNWNAVVKPTDKVYVLGDVAMGRSGLLKVGTLQGKKRVVMGNHDQAKLHIYTELFERVYGAKCLDGMILTHIPVHASQLTRRSMQVNLHGHLHEARVTYEIWDSDGCYHAADPRYQCVSMEQTNFTPIHYDDVVAKFGEFLKCSESPSGS